MRVLFDNGTPRGVAAALVGHTVEEARSRGWDMLKNGELLDAAETTGFDVMVTTDRNIRHQQNLRGRRLSLVHFGQGEMEIDQAQAPGDSSCRRCGDAGKRGGSGHMIFPPRRHGPGRSGHLRAMASISASTRLNTSSTGTEGRGSANAHSILSRTARSLLASAASSASRRHALPQSRRKRRRRLCEPALWRQGRAEVSAWNSWMQSSTHRWIREAGQRCPPCVAHPPHLPPSQQHHMPR